MAISGTLTTAILSVRATYKLLKHVYYFEVDDFEEFIDSSNVDKVKVTWRYYIPPTISGVVTISAIIAASRIRDGRTGAAVAACSLSETALREYREKVVETIGANKDQKIHCLLYTSRCV